MRNISGKIVAVLLILTSAPLCGQTIDNNPLRYDPSEFPQWARDLRRFDVITIGAFPFAFFTATFFTDMMRWSQNDWQMTYSPWPLKPAGAYETTDDEKLTVLGVAFIIAIGVAVLDLVVINIKRHKTRTLNDDSAIIRRTTLNNEALNDASIGGNEE
ncbi:MAG: hypothetical protein LBH75_02470 [Treponema sp.]|jgi:hypothetical protein|nr:hypothetical protein [Treponema sp.]